MKMSLQVTIGFFFSIAYEVGWAKGTSGNWLRLVIPWVPRLAQTIGSSSQAHFAAAIAVQLQESSFRNSFTILQVLW